MGRFIQDSNSHGSLRNIQILINSKKAILDKEISDWLKCPIETTWVSPLASDEYAEYRDNDFLDKLGLLEKVSYKLSDFWPKNGPQWDALGKTADRVFIVEAKANIPELVSTPSGAGHVSKLIIEDSFSELKEYLNVTDQVDWTGKFYQYANRLAHLYFLRVRNGIPAYLLFVYFINDQSVEGPSTKGKWEGAIETMEKYMCVPKRHKMRKYIRDIFVDVADLL